MYAIAPQDTPLVASLPIRSRIPISPAVGNIPSYIAARRPNAQKIPISPAVVFSHSDVEDEGTVRFTSDNCPRAEDAHRAAKAPGAARDSATKRRLDFGTDTPPSQTAAHRDAKKANGMFTA